MSHGLESIGLFWCLVEMLYEEGGILPKDEYDRIAFELRTQSDLVKDVVEGYELFSHDTTNFWSDSALKRLKKRAEISEKASRNARKRWDSSESNATALPPQSEGNAIKVKETKVKESIKLHSENFQFFGEIVEQFEKRFYNEKTWLNCYDKLTRIDKYSEGNILFIVKHFRQEGNWWRDSGNFQTLLKLRKKNKEGVKYIEMFDSILMKHKPNEKDRFDNSKFKVQSY